MYRYCVYAVPVFLPFSLPDDSIKPHRRSAETERLWKEIVRSRKLASLFSSFFGNGMPYRSMILRLSQDLSYFTNEFSSAIMLVRTMTKRPGASD